MIGDIMANFILQSTININNFNVKIYHTENETIDTAALSFSLSDIMSLDYPNKIIEKLQDINGVSKIEVFDEQNNLLLVNEKFLP
jgi:hypothetical protein